MAYAAVEEVKAFTQNDDLNEIVVEMLIDAVGEAIDAYCGQSFQSVTGNRVFNWQSGDVLRVDKGLVSLTSITTTAGQTFLPVHITLEPTAGPPYMWLRVKSSADMTFRYGSSPDSAITVTGVWGYKAAVPAAIKQATIMWVLDFYNKRDVRGFNAVNAGGATASMQQPTDQPPADILPLIRPFRRVLLGKLEYGSSAGSLGV